MRVLITVNEKNGANAKLSNHFGHCKYFAIYETETKDLSFVDNNIDHSKQQTPVDQVMIHNPDIIFSLGMGERARNIFAKKNISVKSGNYTDIQAVIKNLDSMDDLNSSCIHDHSEGNTQNE